jgi:hypothetical protein
MDMQTDRSTPSLTRAFAAAGRACAADLLASLVLFVGAALMAGRVWRFPFDDEVFTLTLAESGHSAREVLEFFLAGRDIQPPLADVIFYLLHHAGLSDPQMRLCSLAMTAVALGLVHCLTLAIVGERTQAPARPTTRLIVVLLFGLCPLALGVGDAIRWYPLFALLFAAFLTSYLAAGNTAVRLGSAVALGLAASTNFIAVVVVVAFLLYRYGLERQFRASFDVAYWVVFAVFACPGLISAISIAFRPPQDIGFHQFGSGPFQAIAIDVLGFLGGDVLGVSQVWMILPAALIAAWALLRAIDRTRPSAPAHLLVLTVAVTAAFALFGFSKPRAFLFLAPVVAAIVALFLDRRAADRPMSGTALLVALILIAPLGVLANLNHAAAPFKRNAAIPYQDILDFIRTNQAGNALIASTDEVAAWVLRHEDQRGDRCVSYAVRETACFAPDRHFDSIFVISGHSNQSGNARFMNRFDTAVQGVLAGRTKTAEIHVGRDADAALKTRLTGVPLDDFILKVELYR